MAFLRDNLKLLGFGFTVAIFSSFGQTYFIGVYREPISTAYELSNSDFGLYYMIVTIGSAIGLNRFGHLIDSVPLARYAAGLVLLLAVACLSMGLAGPVFLLFAAMMFVRLMGQGMMTHAAMTTMSRYFDRNRGRAVAIAGLGMPVGQAIFPALAVFLMTRVSWQSSWLVFAGVCLLVALPLVTYLLRHHERRHADWVASSAANGPSDGAVGGKVWRRRDVVRDYRFYLALPAVIVTPFWITAVFFFAEDIASSKGWTMQAFTGLYWLYALGAAVTPLLGGALVDHFGGRRLLPWYPPIMAIGLLVGLVSTGGIGIGIFLALMGLVLGAAGPVNNAMWAEIYGTRYLGEIKALATSLLVLSTALAPYLLGLLLDAGVAFDTLLIAGMVHSLVGSLLVMPVARRR
ncbi:MFS transporter [Kordiimonas lacus]|uniref:Sugar phosphate permease n=1 Tax=Kordiimonas lacus TaxID=637679 RepID=A0A1G6T7D5_9PROT|nr:MFS transporter [Kordiimonas lacus]SDD24377.1 Sugar phosphate permease [Kordiimonas lacus]